jgi:Tfp pilus assembly protein PilO
MWNEFRNLGRLNLMISYLLLILLGFSFCAQAELGDIKTTDLKNEEVSSALNSEPGATLNLEQAEALKKQIETLKENQKKSDELLNELENEK